MASLHRKFDKNFEQMVLDKILSVIDENELPIVGILIDKFRIAFNTYYTDPIKGRTNFLNIDSVLYMLCRSLNMDSTAKKFRFQLGAEKRDQFIDKWISICDANNWNYKNYIMSKKIYSIL
jgi:hypothetical protein